MRLHPRNCYGRDLRHRHAARETLRRFLHNEVRVDFDNDEIAALATEVQRERLWLLRRIERDPNDGTPVLSVQQLLAIAVLNNPQVRLRLELEWAVETVGATPEEPYEAV